jgi:alpha-ketoglutaric semialdehyde dehydrogenase
VRDGRFLERDARLGPAGAHPAAPDLRLRKIGLGPVAVFGASNFPLAFSVAGGDTASALAAGCPVVVKAHGAHPGTSELVGKAVQAAVALRPAGRRVLDAASATAAPSARRWSAIRAIKAVGFTGSRQGGLALVRPPRARPEPIPVYAEMSSINPVFLLPGALARARARAGAGFVDSLTLGSGQFCTNPGLVLALAGAALDRFRRRRREALQAKVGATMLTPGIHSAFNSGVEKLGRTDGVTLVARGQCGTTGLRRPGRAVRDRRRHLPRQPGAGRTKSSAPPR